MALFRWRARLRSAIPLAFLASALVPGAHSVVYVNRAAPGATHDGLTWATAFLTVQEGITAAGPTKDQVWVAQGVYKENLTVGAAVQLYGGFAGTETALAQRDFKARITTLDGDKKERVINMPAGAADAVVDGFTITNGSTTEHGGAIRANDCSPTIRNNAMIGNNANGVGGALYTYHGTPTVMSNIIVNNTSGHAAYYVDAPNNARLVSNVVARNRSNERRRAGIFVAHGPAIIVGNTVTDNYGGSITVYNSDSKVHNNIIAFNSSGFWRENTSPNVELKNNLFYSNMAYEYSGLPESPIGKDGNISADPRLSWDTRGVAHLQVGSPCFNAGTDLQLGAGDNDIDGEGRAQGIAPDIGADESNGATPFQDVIFVKTTGDDLKSGRSWANAKKTVQAALDAAYANGAEIWVAAGIYTEPISLQPGIALYGGFAGTETSRGQRNYRTNATIIDGAQAARVVTGSPWVTRGAVLDGFTIRNGLADYGGGMRLFENASPIIRNNIFRDNYASGQGGAIYHGEGGGAIIIGNVMTDNTSVDRGGAFFGYRCYYATIANNSVVRNVGATSGIDVHNCNPIIVNNTIAWNIGRNSTGEGALMIWDNNTCVATGNIVAFNTSGVRSNSSAANIAMEKNIVFGNFGADWISIASQIGKNGNISVNPMLTLDRYGTAHIAPTSPAKDAGKDLTDFAAMQDIDGQSRKQGAGTDIGADETDGTTPPAGPIIYVKPTGNDANTGLSWALAKKTVQAGINLADSVNGEVWVAAGTYMTNISLKRVASVYGGFAGTETLRTQRNTKTNLSILDGNKNGPVVSADRYVTPAVTLDGFTIRNGYSADWGGGIRCIEWSAPTIINNVIRDNSAVTHGGGIFVYDNGATQFLNNIVIGNYSGNRGGGILIHRAWWSRVAGNSVVGNNSNGYMGGGIDTHACVIPVVNNTIVGNWGDGALTLWDGGGMRAYNNIVAFNQAGVRSNCNIVNTLYRNNLVYGNAGYDWWNNAGIADPAGKNGNKSIDPMVVVDARGAAHIAPASPAKDSGTNGPLLPSDKDIDGGARILNGTVDIGADETDGTTPGATIVFVRPNGDDTKDGLSWANAKRTLQAGIDLASKTTADVWVAIGPYQENITLKTGARLYGGFLGNEASFAQRDWKKNATVIDGNGGRIAIAWSDCGGAVLDGFTLANGFTTEHGSALRSQDASVTLRNCLVTGNYSNNVGAVYALRGSITVQNCTFTYNNGNDSSCLYLDGNWSGRVDNCLFAYNTVRWTGGSGHVLLYRGNASFTNNTIVNNTGTDGLQVWETLGAAYNNIIAFNDAGFRTNAADPDFASNCVFGNLNWDYWPSNMDWTGTRGNISVNPMMVNAAAGNFRLAAGSPCIDTGDTSLAPPGLPDLDGFSRVIGAAVDRGCYEAFTTGTATKLIFQTSPLTGVVNQPITPQPVVVATDAQGRPVTTYNGSVTVAIKAGTGTAGAILGGTKTLTFVGGYAVFTDLAIDKAGKGYVLRATGTLTAAESTPFEVTALPPFLQFTTQPGRAMQNALFGTQPVVKLNDGSGGTMAYSGPVVISIKSGTGAAGAALGGLKTVNAVLGIATYTDLFIDKLGTGYVLGATAGSFTAAESLPFDVTPKAEKLVLVTQPGGAVAGKGMLVQPSIKVVDSNGLTATDFQGSVTVSIKPNTGAAGAVLGGTKTATFVKGVASFFGLTIDKVGLRYVMTATAGTLTADSDTFRVVATTPDLLTRTWTVNADFDEGKYSLVDHKPTNDQINLQSYQQKPYLWVPNLSGSVSKVDVATGNEVARYRTGPFYTYPNPSRTTVDLRGNCYVGNRRVGTLVKLGQEATGDWVDRNGNGVCDTSRDVNGDGDISGTEELPWNQDECVLFEVSLIPGREGTYQPGTFTQYTNDDWNPGIRSLAVDASNNLWAAGYNTSNGPARKFYYIDGATGTILNVADFSATGHTPYGAVTDSNGVIWSSGQGYNHVLRFDPTTSPISWTRVNLPHNPYGIGADNLNHVFVSGWQSSRISRINSVTGVVEKTIEAPYELRGIVCTPDNDVWTVSTNQSRLFRYDNDLTTQKASIPVGAGPSGVAVDANGKLWVCDLNDENIHRVDPATNTVELTKQLKGSAGHYSYSDMTGGVSTSVTARRGTWTVDFDGGDLNRAWGKVSWTQTVPNGTVISVRVQSSNDKIIWSNFENAGNNVDLATTPVGRYLRVEVTFSTQAVGATPILLDLTATAKARPTYTVADATNALKIAAGLMTASADDFARLNVTTSGAPERVNMQDAARILRYVKMGE